MTGTTNEHGAGAGGAPESHGAFLRRAADGELSAGERERLERLSATDAARVEFERGLREGVRRVMGKERAPATMRRRVVEAMRAAGDLTPDAPATVGGEATRSRSFWRRRVAAPAAAAAALLLVTMGAVVLLGEGHPPAPPAGQPWTEGFGARLIGFVESQHGACEAFGSAQRSKMTITSEAEARAAMERLMGAAPATITLDSVGYTFVGYGRCGVPGGAPSGHAIYRSADGSHAPVSLFVQRDDGQVLVEPGRRLCTACEKHEGCTTRVRVWRSGGLVFYLVTSDGVDAGALCSALGGPDDEFSI